MHAFGAEDGERFAESFMVCSNILFPNHPQPGNSAYFPSFKKAVTSATDRVAARAEPLKAPPDSLKTGQWVSLNFQAHNPIQKIGERVEARMRPKPGSLWPLSCQPRYKGN
jgi:hypothetical protein